MTVTEADALTVAWAGARLDGQVTGRTYGEMRSEAEKRYDAQVMERVKAGMALLEKEYGPSWVDKIDLKTLNLADGSQCVLGQVYRDEAAGDQGYDWALEHIDTFQVEDDANYGFSAPIRRIRGPEYDHYDSWGALQDAWVDALTPIVTKTEA